MTDAAENRGLLSALEAIAADTGEEGCTLGEFVDALGERAFGIILFAMALPVSIPFLYGVPQIMSLPMMALSAQMAMGRDEPAGEDGGPSEAPLGSEDGGGSDSWGTTPRGYGMRRVASVHAAQALADMVS